jgi:4-amino-4-deoxy-L-arabinose transferase-like glycosyltransferase
MMHRSVDVRALARPLSATLASGALFWLVLRLAVRGVLPTLLVAVMAPLAVLLLVASLFHAGVALGPLATDESGNERPLLRRHGFWVVATGAIVGLPMLGAFGLLDPWETHYAEVAREMIERRDFISPWWAHEGWFMSKPVLTFWLEAGAMVLLGVRTGPDEVLTGAAGAFARPEWAIRLPSFLLALCGSYLLYHGVSRTCGRRAALLGGVALWTMPGFALLSHQAMTDMPLVACVAGSLGLLLRALSTNDAVGVTRHDVRVFGRSFEIHAGHALAFAFSLIMALQIVGLVLAHLSVDASGWHLGPDRLVAGSPHACTLPGQPACSAVTLAHPRLTPGLQAWLWALGATFIATRIARETRVARLFALGAWGLAAVAAMAKGPAGLAVPAGAALLYALSVRSLRPLLRLEIPLGLLVALAAIGPWYLAVYARHGRVFLDELVLRHMLGRALDHLHDTNDGEDVGIAYFVRQLGYATFPWSGVAIGAALGIPKEDDRSRRGLAKVVLFGAACLSFALVSAMKTKFHHYVLVALPPLAMITGSFLDERIAASARGTQRRTWAILLALAAACVVALVARDLVATPARFALLLTYRYSRQWPSTVAFATVIGAAGAASGVATAALASSRLRAKSTAVLCGAALALSFVLLDAYLLGCADDGGQRAVVTAYYRDRAERSVGDASGPLVAYQLNWKGENFYTGNALAIFVSSGAPMRTHLDARRARGERTVWFVTERGRVAALRAELGAVAAFAELTDRQVSDEFTLVRAEL